MELPPPPPLVAPSERSSIGPRSRTKGSLLQRLYLGCRTQTQAEARTTDRRTLLIYHALPAEESQLEHQLQHNQAVVISAELKLTVVHRQADGYYGYVFSYKRRFRV